MLKKIFIGVLGVLILALVFHSFIIGTVVKPQVERQASKILGTDVKIAVLSVRLWPGSAAIYGLKIKNPNGFSDGYLLDLGSFHVSLNVPALMKEFANGATGTKSIIIDHVKIKGLKLFVERLIRDQKPQSNLEKLTENLSNSQKAEQANSDASAKSADPAKKSLDLKIELKKFIFSDGKITVRDATIGSGFEYAVDKINIEIENIFVPAKPANELVENLNVSAQLGTKKAGVVSLKGRSNLMAGSNIDAKLSIKDVDIADFDAFITEQPFRITAGKFDLESAIQILDSQLQSQHQLKLSSLQLKGRLGDSQTLLDLPLQTLLTTLSSLPALDVPFEVNGDLKNPQFNVTRALKTAIGNGIQRVLASGLGDLKGAAKELKVVADGLSGQALNMVATGTPEKLGDDAKKLIQGLGGETSESLEGGLKKLSGFLAKTKEKQV